MTKLVPSTRTLLYATVLTAPYLGWWNQARKTDHLQQRVAQIEQRLTQFDIRITALSMAVLASMGEEQANDR